MTGHFGWPLVCPKCYDQPGRYFGILKVPSERVDMNCPNCKTRLVDIKRMEQSQRLSYPRKEHG